MAKKEGLARMPTSKPSLRKASQQNLQKHNDFTLVELLVVLAIMSLGAVLFIGASGNGSGIDKKSEIAKLEQEIADARRLALQSAATQVVDFDKSALVLKPTLGTARNLIFYSDGSTNGGSVISANREVFKVRWIDGVIIK